MEVKTKRNIGQACWTMKNNKAVKFIIKAVRVWIEESGVSELYEPYGTIDTVFEDNTYDTKEELIKAVFEDADNV